MVRDTVAGGWNITIYLQHWQGGVMSIIIIIIDWADDRTGWWIKHNPHMSALAGRALEWILASNQMIWRHGACPSNISAISSPPQRASLRSKEPGLLCRFLGKKERNLAQADVCKFVLDVCSTEREDLSSFVRRTRQKLISSAHSFLPRKDKLF